MGHPAEVLHEAGIGGQLGAAEQLAERGELAVVAGGDDQVAVAAGGDFGGGRHRIGVAGAPRQLAGHLVAERQVAVDGHRGVEHGGVDVLAFAGGLAVVERAQQGDGGVKAGQDVGDGDGGAHRLPPPRPVGLAAGAHQAGHALQDEVIGRAGGVGAVGAEAGDRAIDHVRAQRADGFVVQAVFFQAAGLVIFHHHVAAGGQLPHQFRALRPGDVDGDRLLAAVAGEIEGRVVGLRAIGIGQERSHLAGIVAVAGLLDLVDGGAHVGQVLRGPRACHHARQVEYLDAFENCAHELATRRKRDPASLAGSGAHAICQCGSRLTAGRKRACGRLGVDGDRATRPGCVYVAPGLDLNRNWGWPRRASAGAAPRVCACC